MNQGGLEHEAEARTSAGLGSFCATALRHAALAGDLFKGDDGVGDPYYPKMGNTGYDVQSYDVDLKYRRSGKVTATTTIQAIADTDGGAPGPGPDWLRSTSTFAARASPDLDGRRKPALSSRKDRS